MKSRIAMVLAFALAGCSSSDLPAEDETTGGAPPTEERGPGADPPTLGGSPGRGGENGEDARDGGGDPGAGEPSDPSGTATGDGGVAVDGGADGGATDTGPVTAFTGAAPYQATLGPSSTSNRHAPANPAGTACLSCHGGQRPNVRPFLFAGTLYDGAGQPVPSAEVRLRDRLGAGASAYTDANGNFFAPRVGALAAPARAGVRNAATTKTMTNVLNNGDCNSCHSGPMRLTL